MQPSLKYYVYAYIRSIPSSGCPVGSPYYIGKGTGKRRFHKKGHRIGIPKNPLFIVVLEENLTEVGAYALERRLIRWYGRKDNDTGILRNLTDGGEGGTGTKRSEEWKKNLSEKLTGRTFTDEHRKNIGKTSRERTPWNKNIKGRQKAWNKDIPCSEDTKQKISNANRNPSSETRRKISESREKIYEQLLEKNLLDQKSTNTSGYTGVSRNKHSYIAYIRINRKQIYLGSFKTLEEAVLIRKKAENICLNKELDLEIRFKEVEILANENELKNLRHSKKSGFCK